MGHLGAGLQDLIDRWGLPELLAKYKRLRTEPFKGGCLNLAGDLDFSAEKPGAVQVTDSFALRISVPVDFPYVPPRVYPLGNRIPSSFHRLDCGALCLGSPTRQLLFLSHQSTLRPFIDQFVIPYLYTFVCHERNLPLPFGELSHGRRGILEDFQSMFNVASDSEATALVLLTSRPKRKANRQICPCGKRVRLSRCNEHHKTVLYLRKQLGRIWFKYQYEEISGGMKKRLGNI